MASSRIAAAPTPLGTFERYLSAWVAACIVAGLVLGEWAAPPLEVRAQVS